MAGQINIAGTSGSVQLFGNDTIVTDINIYFPPAGGLLFANGNALEATDGTFSGEVTVASTLTSGPLTVHRGDGVTNVLQCSSAGNVVFGDNSDVVISDGKITAAGTISSTDGTNSANLNNGSIAVQYPGIDDSTTYFRARKSTIDTQFMIWGDGTTLIGGSQNPGLWPADTGEKIRLNGSDGSIKTVGDIHVNNVLTRNPTGSTRAHVFYGFNGSTNVFVNFVDFGNNTAHIFQPQGGSSTLTQLTINANKVKTTAGLVVASYEETVSDLQDVNDGNYLQVTTSAGAKGITYDIGSDIRLKENIQPSVVNATEIVDSLDFISYDWKDKERHGKDNVKLGVSAQQLQSLESELVGEFSDGYLKLNSNQITMYLLKALQESNKRIKDLESEVAALKS